MERSDLFISATCTLGFISLFKFLIHSLRWIWVMLLRPPKNLKHYGSWAIVTGSTDGIGKAIAFELASKGLNLLLVGRSPQKLEAMMKEIRERHNNNNDDVEVKVVVMDLGSLNGEEIMRRMEEGMEGLDVGVLVNSAGMAGPYFRYFDEDDMEFVDGIIKVNLEGGTRITKAVLPWMMKKKKGVIVNIGSASSGVVPSYPLSSLYASTKA
ncbi:very-long-chain 3-oxoacyl-CoA reductase 1-like [Senna tora]|uniref:Very-long-chain 3-oxoacyl-CoA reductase 1-like n=1 Tax=Senna tora TaxID=362788 RepID=A0A834X8B0_9FABA|nr:very-long-chain 3-oxoacyl-CoA reductase 1-like [Senna tora]